MGMIWVAYRRDPSTVQQLMEDPDSVDELLESDDDGATAVDVDKAWHGIHWLLTGSEAPTADPASDVIFGGEPFGEDLGYGPARLLSVDGVVEVARVLSDLDLAALRGRMDPAMMDSAGVYPMIWDEEDVFDTYLIPALQELQSFYRDAAADGEVVIQTIC